MEKKSDAPDRIDAALIQMSHDAITSIAESINNALTDVENGTDEFEAMAKNHPKDKVEKIIKRGYKKANRIIEDEFPESKEEPEEPESHKAEVVAVGLAAAAGIASQTATVAASGMETKAVLMQAVHNPVIMTQNARLRRFESPTKYYERTVSKAIKDVVSGTLTHEQAVKKTVRELTRSGLRYVNYKSGWCNRTNVAVRRAITTEITHDMAERAFANALQLGVQYFEVEYHDGARPEHAEWQGKVYTEQELYDVCGLGEVDGLCGANCYHYFYPFDPETSERLYTDEFLAQQLKESKMTSMYDGVPYTPYEARQQMRQMESAMRIQREKIDMLNKCGIDAKTDRAKYTAQRRQYERFSTAMKVKTDYRRVYQDGLGRV